MFGSGRMGKIHAANILQSPDAQLKYIVDKDPIAAKTAASMFGCSVTNDTKVFKDNEVNAIIITSPTPSHLEIITEACHAHKHIFCEKPLASNSNQAAEVVKIVESSKVLFLTAFNRRFDPSISKLRQNIIDNKIGDLRHLLIISRDPEPPPLSYIKISGGLVRDMMIHDLDLSLWILDEEITEITAIGCNKVDPEISKIGDIDTAFVTLKTKSDKVVQIINSRASAYGYDQRIEAFGGSGALFVDNHKETQVRLATKEGISGDKYKFFFLERYQQAYKLELEHFFKSIHDNSQPLISARDGLNAILLADRVMEKLPQIKI